MLKLLETIAGFLEVAHPFLTRLVAALKVLFGKTLVLLRLKAERVQDRDEDEERRWAQLSDRWRRVRPTTGLLWRVTFPGAREAADFVDRKLKPLAARAGAEPDVVVDGHEVHLAIGMEVPPILTEGDRRFALALDQAVAAEESGD